MGLTLKEVMYLNADYIKINRIMADQLKNGKPRDNWFKNFMKRNKLSKKKGRNDFNCSKGQYLKPIYYIWLFDQLEKFFKNTEVDEKKISNCNESGFPTRGYVVLVALRVIHL